MGNNLFSPHLMSSLSIISAMITPAILILATGNLVSSTLTRVGRVFDRARAIMDRMEECVRNGDLWGADLYNKLLQDYRTRATLTERALTIFYASIGLFVMASLAIGLDNFIHDTIPWLATTLTVGGAILLLLGTLALFLETNIAAGLLRREIEIAQRGRGA
ncbi:MAG: DUF2721 domain-containing protein [Candidatus Eremiobacteraeota bacterium]|nr:DUF2721 domain-containing protein [Candidatus Eremiobacteraeota bacterium]